MSEEPSGPIPPQARDAFRRTRLANERTYLAWWRTGLTSFAVALGAGKVVPELSDGSSWPYTLLGAGFALVGLFFMVYGTRRFRDVQRALEQGRYTEPDERMTQILSFMGVALGVLLLLVVVFG